MPEGGPEGEHDRHDQDDGRQHRAQQDHQDEQHQQQDDRDDHEVVAVGGVPGVEEERRAAAHQRVGAVEVVHGVADPFDGGEGRGRGGVGVDGGLDEGDVTGRDRGLGRLHALETRQRLGDRGVGAGPGHHHHRVGLVDQTGVHQDLLTGHGLELLGVGVLGRRARSCRGGAGRGRRSPAARR